jgi:signal transduction histidine kinase
MKLSIQYLLHAYQREPERIGTLLPDAAATLSEQVDGLARIATEFSNFAQMPQAENQPVPLAEALLVSVELFRQGQNTLHVELPEEEIWVFADRRLLVRVFNNLLQNAFQAIPPERIPDIQVQLDTLGPTARIRFRDNGTGIPEAIQESVFYPNFTTKSSGMGLGLAICRNIILQAGGSIYFRTIENQGTEFFIELPLHQVTYPIG